MIITISAPGKVILSGEHAVVYGKPALVAAVNRRIQINLHVTKNKVSLQGKSNVPIGCGMGSSAALSVVQAEVVNKLYQLGLAQAQVNNIAYDLERKYHGSPSGVDNTVSTVGGFIWYRKEFEFLKNIWQLPIKVSSKMDRFVLINSGKPIESTKKMVQKVKSKSKSKTLQVMQLFNDIELQTKKMLLALRGESEKDLKDSISENGRLLIKLGVVGKKAQKIIQNVEKKGGVAKITGAGGAKEGSGMILCYHKTPEALIDLASSMDLDSFRVRLGADGLTVKHI